jgi:hypothetical protein
MITVSEWLLEYLRSCPDFEPFLYYNSQQPEEGSAAIVENQGQAKRIRFVDGSFTSTLPFMLLVRVHQDEDDEIALQTAFSKLVKWIRENDPENTRINEIASVMSLEVQSNLIPEVRDDQGNITYRAIFMLQYYQGGNANA